MNANSRVDLARRRWLLELSALAALPVVGVYAGCADEEPPAVALDQWLCRFVADGGDGGALRRLGALYIASQPLEGNRQWLSQALLGSAGAPVAQTLTAAIAQDWRNRDLVVLDGWLHSRTEARICALVHISGDSPA